MFINYGNLRHKWILHPRIMREKPPPPPPNTEGIISAEMKLYLKEKIFKDQLQGKQPSTSKVLLGLLWPLIIHQAANGKQLGVSETM